MSTPHTSSDSSQPRIAMAMADDYPWDVVRERQLPGIDFEVWPDCRDWTEAELCQRIRSVTAIVTGRESPMLPDGLIDDPGDFNVLIHCHGGVRNRLKLEHVHAGITVTNWGKSGGILAEGALTLLLACFHQLPSLHAWALTDKQTDQRIHQNYSAHLGGANIGIYGFGPIGRTFAEYMSHFSDKLAIYDPYAENVPEGIKVCDSLEELFDHSDAVSIHCGLNDYTRNSVTGDLLDRLPQGGILVNTARGGIVDEDALAKRVHAGRVLAGIDVCNHEPTWSQSPLVGTPNAILTSHRISSPKGPEASRRGPKLLAEYAVHNVKAVINGTELKNVITPEEYVLKT